MSEKGSSSYKNINSSDRDAAIAKLERERLKVNAEIEKILKLYAKETGMHSISNRKHKIGKAPNDWKE